jgi:hypothetical protein
VQVEGKLPEHGIDAVFNDGGESCPGPVIKRRGQAKVLLHDVSLFEMALLRAIVTTQRK